MFINDFNKVYFFCLRRGGGRGKVFCQNQATLRFLVEFFHIAQVELVSDACSETMHFFKEENFSYWLIICDGLRLVLLVGGIIDRVTSDCIRNPENF